MGHKLTHPRRPLNDILQEMQDCGYCRDFQEVADGCYSTLPTLQWSNLAKAASAIANGVWHPQHNGVRWQNGNKNSYIIASDGLTELLRVRGMVETFTGRSVGYSYGSAARNCLLWSCEKREPLPPDTGIIAGKHIAYNECSAGTYPNAKLYDASACYFQLIRRLPSLDAHLSSRGNVRFIPMKSNESARLNDVYELVKGEKLLRNSMWGSMLGSNEGKVCFFNNERRLSPRYFGTHYAAAALVARTAYELTQLACHETNAIYAMTDGIIVKGDAKPKTWNAVGLEYSEKARGDAHILHTHVWRIGHKRTKWYSSKSVYYENTPRTPMLPDYLFRQWL